MKAFWLAAVFVLFAARSVAAAEPGRVSADESSGSSRGEWYGWQTMLVDVASLGLGGTLIGLNNHGSDEGAAGDIGGALLIGGYVLGGPVVHGAHGQWGKAGTSLGLRLGAPLAGALGGYVLGYAACPRDDESDVPCSAVTAGLGLVLGAAAAVVVDSTVLAYEPAPQAANRARITPVIIAERDRWGAGLAGSF